MKTRRFANVSDRYRRAIEFVALNYDTDTISGYISVILISEVWSVPARRVAEDVISLREQHAYSDSEGRTR